MTEPARRPAGGTESEASSAEPVGLRLEPSGADAQTPSERNGIGGAPGRPLPILTEHLDDIPLRPRARRSTAIFLLVAGVFAALYLPNAGAFGLWDPWETHYGEVTRSMVESYDWVAPWWGFKQKIGTEAQEGSPFFSKPVFIFWSEAVFVKLIGLSEWAIRLPFALLALATALVVFVVFSRLYGRRIGFLAALVMGTSPQFFFLARQAQTDMPYVATMTMGICFFLLAVFSGREELSNRRFLTRIGLVVGFILLSTLPQFGLIATDLKSQLDVSRVPGFNRIWLTVQGNGVWHVVAWSAILLAVLLSMAVPLVREWRRTRTWSDETKDLWSRRLWLWCFYALVAHSTLAKGLLGFMLPGAVIFFFVLVTGTWRSLKRLELLRGIALFAVIAVPWYAAMFAKFGMPYYTRFFIHDHFNRIGAGVHQIDTGTFEHFIKWLGFGMFPWVAFVPFAFAAFARFRVRDASPEVLLKLFLFLWFFLSFTLFTLSSTKFHHYIFPALPPLAILVALYLFDLLEDRAVARRLVVIVAVGLLAAITWDLHGDTQHLRNLFTYKYDRPLPPIMPTDANGVVAKGASTIWADSVFYAHTNPLVLNLLNMGSLRYDRVILWMGGGAVAFTLLLLGRRTRRIGLWGLGGVSGLLTVYVLNHYMPMLSTHWSQKYLFEAYYADCTPVAQPEPIEQAFTPVVASVGLGAVSTYLGAQPKRVCDEDIVSWLITWRGETYYSNNEIRPVNKEATQFEPYLKDFNKGRPFYVLMERGKDAAWASKLNGTYLKKLRGESGFKDIQRYDVTRIYDENEYFILLKAVPIRVGAGASPVDEVGDVPEAEVEGAVVPD
ncbi:MAG: hypothetical protein AMXMBFR64_09350 [Myxococcales bacterium]